MTIKELESKLKDEVKKLMTSPKFGFTDGSKEKWDCNWDDYSVVEVYDDPEGRGYKVAEIRAEVSYDGLDDLCNACDPIVAQVDPDAYFEPYTYGIARAYIQSNKLK